MLNFLLPCIFWIFPREAYINLSACFDCQLIQNIVHTAPRQIILVNIAIYGSYKSGIIGLWHGGFRGCCQSYAGMVNIIMCNFLSCVFCVLADTKGVSLIKLKLDWLLYNNRSIVNIFMRVKPIFAAELCRKWGNTRAVFFYRIRKIFVVPYRTVQHSWRAET
jgi:hypothetical protein